MNVVVDPSACQGHARCNAVAPEVYPLDDDGFVALPTSSPVADGHEDAAQRGATACPERALAVVD